MKKISFILALMIIQQFSTSAQEIQTETCASCKALGSVNNGGFPYAVCAPGTSAITWICSPDPYNLPAGYKVFKLCYPFSTSYDDNNLSIKAFGYGDPDDPDDYTGVFDTEDLEQIISDQLAKWTSICTPFSDPSNCTNCTVKVKWADDMDYIGHANKISNAAYTQIEKEPTTGTPTCRANCDKFNILLNATNSYAQYDGDGYPHKFFRTKTLISNDGHPSYMDSYLDMKKVVLHELGHALGFEHTIPANPCGSSSSIMSSDWVESSFSSPGTLGVYDQCMFRLLYCCEPPSDVHEEPTTINSTFNIFPNPTSSSVTIALSPSTTQYVKRLRVVDITGKTVFEQVFPAGSSNCLVQTNELTKGSYLFVMTFEGINGSYAEKVIIQ